MTMHNQFMRLALLFCTLPLAGFANAADRAVPPPEDEYQRSAETEKAELVVAGGCFWCTEVVFEQVKGVIDVTSGYAGGSVINANYKAVSRGQTEHAESIRITYDPGRVSFGKLLQIFFTMHDPTQLNRQGPDIGKQYRSTIFYSDEKQKDFAESYMRQLNESRIFNQPIVTTLEKLESFFPAEDYHQDYVKKNPRDAYVRQWALPKIRKVKKLFPDATIP